MNARAFLLLLPLTAEAATLNIDCDAGDTIQDALTRVKPADTIVVSGTCNARAEDLSPNTIQNNGLDGIVVQRSSTAWIAGNIVRGNKLNGIVVDRHS
jgi:parallel beta-helix repeat protein